ncbi:MAG: porphobilinogen synthase [Solirubrobacterales bacterium]
MAFPQTRMRRLRRTAGLRSLVREERLDPAGLVLPIFVAEGISAPEPVQAMPGVVRHPVAGAVEEAREAAALGIGGVILFGIPASRDAEGSGAWARDGIVQQALGELAAADTGLVLIADTCLCEYTDHGHCGPLDATGADVDNDAALELLARTAVSQAQAGADIVAPSDMMDGRVAAIREALDQAGFDKTPIISYAAKYASSFYGPFREAAESTPQFGDRRSYQMDPANAREALKEMELDLAEGADMLMVKPAMPYLDIIKAAHENFDVPIAAYQVSGEFSMIHAAARNGWIDLDRAMMESLTSINRAGAQIILTYFAKAAARQISGL